MTPFDPDYVVPTSEVLEEYLDMNNLTTRMAACCVARRNTPEHIAATAILDGVLHDVAVTVPVADVLSRATGIPAAFWLSFEHNYRTGLAAGKLVSR